MSDNPLVAIVEHMPVHADVHLSTYAFAHLMAVAHRALCLRFRLPGVGGEEGQHVLCVGPKCSCAGDRLRVPQRDYIALPVVPLRHPGKHVSLKRNAGHVHTERLEDALTHDVLVAPFSYPRKHYA